jgi:hypothetical protein
MSGGMTATAEVEFGGTGGGTDDMMKTTSGGTAYTSGQDQTSGRRANDVLSRYTSSKAKWKYAPQVSTR